MNVTRAGLNCNSSPVFGGEIIDSSDRIHKTKYWVENGDKYREAEKKQRTRERERERERDRERERERERERDRCEDMWVCEESWGVKMVMSVGKGGWGLNMGEIKCGPTVLVGEWCTRLKRVSNMWKIIEAGWKMRGKSEECGDCDGRGKKRSKEAVLTRGERIRVGNL